MSLKAEKVNVRRGPSSDHPVAWVFQRKGLPVEIVAEFENWRRIRNSDGEEGWILQNMLAGKRTAEGGALEAGPERAAAERPEEWLRHRRGSGLRCGCRGRGL